MKISALLAVAILSVLCPSAAAQAPLVPPVEAPIARGFAPPTHTYGPGHRGIDYAIVDGAVVTAAGDGVVTFAGDVPGGAAVTIDHGGGLQTTYSLLAGVNVDEGTEVIAGAAIGYSGRAHAGVAGLHFGVRLEGAYVNPEPLLIEIDPSGAIGLMPIGYQPTRIAGMEIEVRAATGRTPERCVEGWELERPASAPNDNILVAVGGITSASNDEVLTKLPAWLGYGPADAYRFSYAGASGLDLHDDYGPSDTYGDIVTEARELRSLLEEIARRHPGRKIDLVAHSQGGIVVRTFLELVPKGSGVPFIEHVVTLASPHRGAPGAAAARDIDHASFGLLSGALRAAGEPFPAPSSTAIGQLAPGSELMDALGGGTPPFGTRYLTIGIANDWVVPADRAEVPGADRDGVLSPEGWMSGHSAIVSSTGARARAYDFLRDAPDTCDGFWDPAGRWMGRAISAGERALGWGARALQFAPGGLRHRVLAGVARRALDR